MNTTTDSPTRKLFIGGLSWKTSDAAFRNFFSRFGEIEDCVVMRERGFGFVTFRDEKMAQAVMSAMPLELDGRQIDPKFAIPKDEMTKRGPKTKKIFVGGVSLDLDLTEFKAYFGRWGTINDAVLIKDEQGRPRGFGFVEYEHEDSADAACAQPQHTVGGRTVEVKKAVPKDKDMRGSRGGDRDSRSRGGRGRSPEPRSSRHSRSDRDRDYYDQPSGYYEPDGYGRRGGYDDRDSYRRASAPLPAYPPAPVYGGAYDTSFDRRGAPPPMAYPSYPTTPTAAPPVSGYPSYGRPAVPSPASGPSGASRTYAAAPPASGYYAGATARGGSTYGGYSNGQAAPGAQYDYPSYDASAPPAAPQPVEYPSYQYSDQPYPTYR